MNIRKIKKNVMAVSPIIATLMLVLVAAGAAASFYLWQTGWQENAADNTGEATVTEAIKVGGSSTVYEFTVIAKELFESKYPNYRIDLQKGGSTSGVKGAGWGLVDIGCSSSDPTTKIEDNNLPDIDRDGMKDIGHEMVQTTIGYDGVVVVTSAANTHGLKNITRADLVDIYEGDITTWSALSDGDASPSPCDGDEKITVIHRADHSGTEECFAKKICGEEITKNEKQYENVDSRVTDEAYYSNQEMLSALANNKDAIGFAPYGMLNSDLVQIGFDADGTGFHDLNTTADVASGAWVGSRPLVMLTIGEPKGDAKVFIDWCMTTDVNQQICEMAGYVSVYDA